MLFPFLAALIALACTALAANAPTKAKLHAWRKPSLCVALSDDTYSRKVVLRPCDHPTATWIIRDDEGPTFIRHQNVCLNGGWMALDGGFNTGNGEATYGHYCQFEALRNGWDWTGDVSFPWRWFRRGNQFHTFGYQDTVWGPCLDIKDGNLWDGAKLQIWECHDSSHRDYDNQRFSIEWLGPEYP